MEDGYLISGIILFILFVLIDGALFGFAAAAGEVNTGDLSKRADNGDKKAQNILKLINNGTRLNYTIQVMAMIMNVVVGAYILNVFSQYINTLPYGKVLVAAALMVIAAVFGIIIPVKVCILRADKMIGRLYGIVSWVLILLSPIILIITFVGNCVIRLFGMNPYVENDNVTEEEILTMVNEGHEQGVIEADEAELITNIFEFCDKEAVDIMTHRKNILALDGNMTLEEAVTFMLHENYSRYPVYDGDIDNIIGTLHIKDALKEYGNRVNRDEPVKDIPEVMFDAVLIPGTRNINDLFKSMQSEKVHQVIVVDEYGQTVGLVTMEDILEEIVGNIFDEHDEEEEQITQKDDNSYVVDGLTLLEDLEDELSIDFYVDDIDTLNGFLILKTGKIPSPDQVGTEIIYEGFVFKILETEKKIIRTVGITKLPEKQENENNTEK
ncbi:MAG: hemolysin family protein [Alistipes sp.]|nr:hemolysin family protein [Alistipes sp.]